MTERTHVVVGTAADTTVTVTRSHASEDPPQGLVLESDHPLRVGETKAERIVLWSDTAPEQVDVITGDAGDLRMWNVWRDGRLIQAWEGDARMEVDDDGDDLGLDCHDGRGGDRPTLSVRVSFDRAWTQPTDDD